MLVEPRFDNFSYSFSGHETFPLRYAWLSKAVQHLQSSRELFLGSHVESFLPLPRVGGTAKALWNRPKVIGESSSHGRRALLIQALVLRLWQ